MDPCPDLPDYQLLHLFARLEFKLKLVPRFLRTGSKRRAEVAWWSVAKALKTVPPESFVGMVSPTTHQKVLASGRNRPKVQLVFDAADGEPYADFAFSNLPDEEAPALLEAVSP